MAYPERHSPRGFAYVVTVHDGEPEVASDVENYRSVMLGPPRTGDELTDSILAAFDWLYDEQPRNLAECYRWANGLGPSAWTSTVGKDYYCAASFQAKPIPKPRPPRKAKRRIGWSRLSESYRRNLVGTGRQTYAMTPEQVRRYWERGGDMRLLRRHATTPNTPRDALRDPARYGDYLERHPEAFRGALGGWAAMVWAAQRYGGARWLERCHTWVQPGEDTKRHPHSGGRHGG